MGIESERGSPFNIQRSLHVPNLTADEVRDLYEQYQTESGQTIDPAVVEKVYEVTRGQPGLVSWFGMLLTETYNPGPSQLLGMQTWAYVWEAARFVEPNNTMLNLIAKARMVEYQGFLIDLFQKADMPFMFYHPVHNYLYMHGIVEPTNIPDAGRPFRTMCRFSSPYVQDCLYQALGAELVTDTDKVLALQPLDDLADVFAGPTMHIPALLTRYTDYLARLKSAGINPWKSQPRREPDYQLTEAVGHFHLYAWLQQAIGKRCVVSPEFPTGNGTIDMHLRCNDQQGLIEVKSFVDKYQLTIDKPKAAAYAKQLGLDVVTMAAFIPVLDKEILAQLSGTEMHDGVQVHVVKIGWF